MKITGELAQPIVDNLKEVIGLPISIIDHDGIIVACTNPSRVGSFHQGAIVVLEQQKELVVDEFAARDLQGTREGITMPIVHNGEFVGAIGVTGQPDAIKDIAHIIRVAVLSLAEQASQAQISLNRRRIHDSWASRLCAERLGDVANIAEQAGRLGIDASCSCSAILIKTQPVSYTDFAVHERIAIEVIESYGKLHFNAYVGQGHYLLAVQAREGVDEGWLTPMCLELYRQIESRTKDFWLGVGKPGSDILGYRQSFFDANQSVHIMERLEMKRRILFYYELRFLRLLEYIPEQAREAFCDSYLHKTAMSPTLAHTLAVYFDKDCHPVRAADALYIHRNTLNYRLGRIQELYGLDPRNFSDAVILQIILNLQGQM
jgi:carbohydrate diacid regulator